MSSRSNPLRAKARSASPIRAHLGPEDSFVFGDEQNQSRITLNMAGNLRKEAGIQFNVQNTVVKGQGARFDPAVQIRQSGDITHVIEMEVPIGERVDLARAFGSANVPNVQETPLQFWEGDVDETVLAITHEWKQGIDPSPGDEARIKATPQTRAGSRTQGPTSVIVGNPTAATKVTINLLDASLDREVGETTISFSIDTEPVGSSSGFGTGLDVGLFDGTTLVNPEIKSFGTSASTEKTMTFDQVLRQPCIRVTSIERTLSPDSPPVGWSCGPVLTGQGGGGGGGGGVAGGLLAGSTTLLLGGAAVVLLVLLAGRDGEQRQTRR